MYLIPKSVFFSTLFFSFDPPNTCIIPHYLLNMTCNLIFVLCDVTVFCVCVRIIIRPLLFSLCFYPFFPASHGRSEFCLLYYLPLYIINTNTVFGNINICLISLYCLFISNLKRTGSKCLYLCFTFFKTTIYLPNCYCNFLPCWWECRIGWTQKLIIV